MNSCISAIQHLRPLRGGAQSQLLRASDGNSYVTKFQNNPQHIRVLANELLATRLGLTLGLPMPRVEIIEVSDWLIEHTEDLRIDLGGQRIRCQIGKAIGFALRGLPRDDAGLLAAGTSYAGQQRRRLRPSARPGQVGLQRGWSASSLRS